VDTHHPILPAEKAFVVQFGAGAVSGDQRAGRVEHVVSGQGAWFASFDEMSRFMVTILGSLAPVVLGWLVLSACPAQAAAPSCSRQWLTAPALTRGSTLECDDGDPTCDLGSDPNSCTFRVGMCFNVDDPNLAACSPTDVHEARLVGRTRRRGSDPAGAEIQDVLYDALGGLGAQVAGVCTNVGPNKGAICAVNAGCNSPGQVDGNCERRATFEPPLHGLDRCTGAALVRVPLRNRGGGYSRDSRRLKVRVAGGGSFRSLRLLCNPKPVTPPRTYDVTETSSLDPAAYVPTVDQLTILSMTVQSDHGGPLTVGHPVEMRAEIDVQAEPFQSTVWYGLQNGDGDYCVIDHIAVEHLGAVYDLANRANLAASTHDDGIPTPSLTDCSVTRRCTAEGEDCIAFQRHVATETPVYDPSDSDPMHTAPHVPETGVPPTTAGVEVVTSYLCATQTWAASEVTRTKSVPKLLTPADLAGSVEQRHLVGATDELPAACANLVGDSDVTAWIAFDPEEETHFVQRPAFELPMAPPDAPLDAEHEQANQELSAYLQRLPVTAPIEAVHADPGLDVDFRHLTMGSSVTLVDMDDHPGGDLHVDAEYSLDGTPTPAQAAALPSAQVTFHFTLQPVGEPRDGCVPPAAPALDEVPLQVVHTNADHTFVDVGDEPVTKLSLGTELDHSFPLYLTPDVRERVYGEWSCWEQFDVKGCLTTNLPQAMGTTDDCVTTSVVILRDNPPEGAVIEPPPPEDGAGLASARSASLLASIGASGCSDQLFSQYAENMKKFYELSNSVQITDFYTYDFLRWVWGTLTPGSAGDGLSYITNAERQKGYFNHVKSYLEECEAAGGGGCWTTWGFKNSPWAIDINNYQTKLLPYFWNAYGRSGAENYLKFRNDPQGYTRGGFNYECAGIATGAVCSEINYDLARVPELATKIRNVLVNRRLTDPLAAKISPYGVGRCLDRAYPALKRVSVDDYGRTTIIPDDDAFYTQYLNQVCEKGRYKAEADRIWNQIASSCTFVARPFADSGAGIYAGRFVPELYKSFDTGFKAGIKGVVEGGIVNDYIVATPVQQFKLIFGAQGRVYLQSDPTNSVVGGWLDVYDIFKVWMLGNFYSDVVSSNVEAGFHVLTNDIWKISYKIPQGEFELPEPPELSKEKEKCKYLWKPPMPFRVELCGAVGGRVGLDVSAKVLKSGIAGVDPNKADWPGMEGTITPGVAITNKGRAGVDVLVASAGLVVTLDPTIGVYIPVSVGAKWKLVMPNPRLLDFTLAPYVKVALELRALGGSLDGYTRWKIGSTSEQTYPIVDWDPLDIGNLLGQDWTLVKHSWDVSGSRAF
jgi:hypothetical protein